MSLLQIDRNPMQQEFPNRNKKHHSSLSFAVQPGEALKPQSCLPWTTFPWSHSWSSQLLNSHINTVPLILSIRTGFNQALCFVLPWILVLLFCDVHHRPSAWGSWDTCRASPWVVHLYPDSEPPTADSSFVSLHCLTVQWHFTVD